MTDDSAIEQRAIRLAFPGLIAGEQEVAHLLCSVHSNRTLLRRLAAHKPIYQLLKHAMYCFTGTRNQELCQQAIQAAGSDQELARYMRTNWLQTASKWAMHARQHSPLLLQVTTTNACEAWHGKLKTGAGLTKGQVASHGIYGMILNIMDDVDDANNRVMVTKSRFRSRRLACTKQYPEIGQLPVPIQKLLSGEIDALEERVAKGKEVPTGFDESLQCNCKFYRQYLLPCRHIFHLDTEVKVPTTMRWDMYAMMFAECGMAVYETTGIVWVENEIKGGNPVSSFVLRLRERMEQLQQNLYAIHEAMEELSIEETTQNRRLEEWVGHVEETLDVLVKVSPKEVASRHRPWEL